VQEHRLSDRRASHSRPDLEGFRVRPGLFCRWACDPNLSYLWRQRSREATGDKMRTALRIGKAVKRPSSSAAGEVTGDKVRAAFRIGKAVERPSPCAAGKTTLRAGWDRSKILYRGQMARAGLDPILPRRTRESSRPIGAGQIERAAGSGNSS